jgi:hypothetical protein
MQHSSRAAGLLSLYGLSNKKRIKTSDQNLLLVVETLIIAFKVVLPTFRYAS